MGPGEQLLRQNRPPPTHTQVCTREKEEISTWELGTILPKHEGLSSTVTRKGASQNPKDPRPTVCWQLMLEPGDQPKGHTTKEQAAKRMESGETQHSSIWGRKKPSNVCGA